MNLTGEELDVNTIQTAKICALDLEHEGKFSIAG